MSLDPITEEELNFIETWYTPKALLEILFHDWDNLAVFDETRFGELRLYQESMISDESLIDFDLTQREFNLSKKQTFDLKKNVGDLYCFGARKYGKCEWVENKCTLADGTEKPFKDLIGTSQTVLGLNTNTLKLEPTKAFFADNGIKNCLKITLRSGKNITVTENHPFLTANDWKNANELTVGEAIATPRKLDISPFEDVSDEEAKLLGLLLGDGGCTRQIGITNMDKEIIDEIFELAQYFKCGIRRSNMTYYFTNIISDNKINKIGEIVKKYNIRTLSKLKKMPQQVFHWPKHKIALLLNRLFACDGHVNYRIFSIELGLASHALVEAVASLLLRFEIHSTIYYRKDKNGFESWRLFVCDGFDKFLDEIGILSKDKGRRRNRTFSTSDRIPNAFIQKFYSHFENKKPLRLRGLKSYNPSREKCQRMSEKANYEPFTILANSDIRWDEIVEIKPVGMLPTVAVKTKSKYANYISNNIISHNSLCTIILDLINDMMTSDGNKVALASVDLIHIKRVLDPVKNCLQGHSICKLFEKRITSAPDFQFELKNGYTLNSVNSNVGSRNPGGQWLGLHVFKVFLEEASLEPEEVYEKRKDSLSELGAIFRVSGMTDFTPQSPAGQLYYGADTHKHVMNYPQFVSPYWDEAEKQKKIEQYAGENSIGYRVYCKGEVVEDGLTTFDMQRVRQNSISEKKSVKTIEITKDRFKHHQAFLIVERPINSERIFISADIGLNVTEINVMSEVNEKFEYIYNITLNNLTDDEQSSIFKYLAMKLEANVISVDCGDGQGRAIYNELEKTIPKENLVWYAGTNKITTGFETDKDGNAILEMGKPVIKEEFMSEWAVKRLKDLLYNGKCIIPEDYKFITQFSKVVSMITGTRTIYKCICSQGDHLFDSFKVFAIAEWKCASFNSTPRIQEEWGCGANS